MRLIHRLCRSFGRLIHILCDSAVERNEGLHGRRRKFSVTEVHYPYLEILENGWDFNPRVKDQIHTFKLMIRILATFSDFISERGVINYNLRMHFSHVDSVIQDVIRELHLSGVELQLPVDADSRSHSAFANLVRSNLEKLSLLEPEMKKFYYVLSRSSSPLLGLHEDPVRFLNSLLKHLKDLLCWEVDYMLLDLEYKLKFLSSFLIFLSEICNWHEYLDDLFTFAGSVAVEAACVLYFLLVDKMKGEDMLEGNKSKLLYLVEKIRPSQPKVREIYFQALQASRAVINGPLVPDEYALGFFDSLIENLRELSNNETNFEGVSDDQIEVLLEELTLVRDCFINTPPQNCKEGFDNLMTELLYLTIDTGVFIFSNERTESDQIGHLMDKIHFIKNASGDFLIPESWQSNFPKTDELASAKFIIANLKKQLNYNTRLHDPLKCEISIVYEELFALGDDFVKITELQKMDEGIRGLITSYKDVVYRAEYFVDLSLFRDISLQFIWSGFTDIKDNIRQIQQEVKAIAKNMTRDNFAHCFSNDLGDVSSEASPACLIASPMSSRGGTGSNSNGATDQLVGIEDEARKIIEELTGGPDCLNILSIVGMPGIGKTTLANLAYRDPQVSMHFHAQAWCTVSQTYEKQALLLEILHQVRRETKQDPRENVGLDQQLYQSLKGRRYLVILDDIWDIEVWDDLSRSFPDDNNGSRLLFTTRNNEVATHANSVPHNLVLLSDEDSWKLLQGKVFNKETCPPELIGIGKTIANSCGGLPLAVVLIGGLLKTTEGNRNSWEQIGNQLRSYVVEYRSEQQLGTLELSYIHLPDYLKPCFLYFGAFAEDEEIPARKLASLWIAEGFVQPPEVTQNILEYEAENYLNALIDRSLVIVAKRNSRGGVKACRVHDLLHEFCLVKAKEERFLLPVSMDSELPTFWISDMHEQYRLSIFSKVIPTVRMVHFVSRVHTLLFSISSSGYEEIFTRTFYLPPGLDHFNSVDEYDGSYFQRLAEITEMYTDELYSPTSSSKPGFLDHMNVIGILNKFRLLRVLDLGAVDIDGGSIFITISQLVHLKYLAVQAYITEIPKEVANLKKLETFLLTTGSSKTTVLAEAIWSMVSLRHLHVRGGYFHFSKAKLFQKHLKLENLTTLSTPALCCDKNTEKRMRNFPKLRKLNCKFLDSWDPSKRCNRFPELDFLYLLESLRVSFSGKGLYPCKLTFPQLLKKLTLSESRLPWDEISIVGKLPYLEVLKLLDRAFEGSEWDMKDGEFMKLKFLKLQWLDIATWNASSEQLPCIEQLVLDRCFNLEELPSAFGEAATLRMIDMKWCSDSAVLSVKQIKEDQVDLGNDQFKVFIM